MKLALALLAFCVSGCGRKSNVSEKPAMDGAATVEWSKEQSRHAPGMTLRATGSGKGHYKLQDDGCVRVTFRPANAHVTLASGTRKNDGEEGAAPFEGPICGIRGDEWTIDAPNDASWALWATDTDKK